MSLLSSQAAAPAAVVIPGNWHEVLNELLLTPGYSQQRLAKELNLSIATVRRLQQNAKRIPSNKTILKLLSLYCLVSTGAKN